MEEQATNKRLSLKEKRFQRIKNNYFKDDIKYQGPLSYRYLRILGWIAFALGQLAFVSTIGNVASWDPIGNVGRYILSFFSNLMTPLFIIASFGLVLSRRRGYRNFILFYGAAFLGIGIGVLVLYYRYVNGLFVKAGLDDTSLYKLMYSQTCLRSHCSIILLITLRKSCSKERKLLSSVCLVYYLLSMH